MKFCKDHGLPIVCALALLFLAGCGALKDQWGAWTVGQLAKSTIPPNSVILEGPFEFGEGNNPRICRGDSSHYLLASPLARDEIKRFYVGRLSGSWALTSDKADSLAWSKPDQMVAIDYRPWYLFGDPDTKRKFEQAQQQYASVYLLTLIALKCEGPVP